MDGSTAASTEESKNEEICIVFHELLCMAKHMLDEILPDVLLLLDKATIENIIGVCEEFDGSMNVFKKLCGVVAKKNLCLRVQQGLGKHGVSTGTENSTAGTNSSTVARKLSDDTSQLGGKKKPDDTEVTQSSTMASVESHDADDIIWKDLFQQVKEMFDHKKRCSSFYYCGLCNIRCYDTKIWSSHEKGKKHSQRCFEVTCIGVCCETCGFHMVSDIQHIDMVFSSSLHRLYDEAITQEPVASEKSTSGIENCNELTPVVKPNVRSIKVTETGEVYFHESLIVNHFVSLNSELFEHLERRERFTVSCCLACNYLAKQKNQWLKHLNEPVHGSRMKRFKNLLCACVQCDFGMIANDALAILYMRYHIEQCHLQSTDNICLEDYMTIAEAKAPLGSSRPGSFKGSTESMHHSRRSSFADEEPSRPISRNEQTHSKKTSLSSMGVDDTQHSGRSTPFSGRSTPSRSGNPDWENGRATQPEHPSRSSSVISRMGSQETVSLSPDSYGNRTGPADGNFKKSKSAPHKSPSDKVLVEKFDKPSPPPASSEFMVSEDDNFLGPFIHLLRIKEKEYLSNRHSKPFSALCLFCPHLKFSDAFKWCDHILDHPSDSVNNEVECSSCNTNLYGDISQINNILIQHPEHVRIDRLVRY